MAVKRGGKLGTRTSTLTTLPSHPPHVWYPSVTNLPESRGSEETLQSDDSLRSDGWGNLDAGRPLQTDGDAAPPVECDPAAAAALIGEMHVGPCIGHCRRSPLYSGVWRRRRVTILVSSHLAPAEGDAARLERAAAAAAASPTLRHPHLTALLALAVRRRAPGRSDSGGSSRRSSCDSGSGSGGADSPQPRAGQLVEVWTCLEHCELGTLAAAVADHCLHRWPAPDAPPRWRHVAETAREVAQALAHLHARGVALGLLTSSSVHLCRPARIDGRPGERCFVAKVSTACRFVLGQDPFPAKALPWDRTPYAAPELLSGRRNDPSPACDVWSFGVVLWEMCAGTLAWRATDAARWSRALLRGRSPLPPLSTACPPRLRRLAQACMAPRSHGRPTVTAAIAQLHLLLACLPEEA